ncbi:hypothetical protein ACFFRE_13065 [Aciditerrimonas ferrireducens]|uniref:Uncharacterized protein n=1 Tax=Aciditerrimonas ferrireducens TaxID=667306 RepID=A0ABV6C5T8_9ACTN
MRMWFTRRAIVLHLIIAVVVPTFVGLWWWQWHAALAGNELSWAYTFEWPIFTGYAIFVWWKMVHQQPEPKAKGTRVERGAVTRPVGWALEKHPQEFDDQPVEADVPAVLAPAAQGTGTPAMAAAADAPLPALTAPEEDSPGTQEEDPELAAYNEYLAALAASGKRKTW